jgi:hypothetical protein
VTSTDGEPPRKAIKLVGGMLMDDPEGMEEVIEIIKQYC